MTEGITNAQLQDLKNAPLLKIIAGTWPTRIPICEDPNDHFKQAVFGFDGDRVIHFDDIDIASQALAEMHDRGLISTFNTSFWEPGNADSRDNHNPEHDRLRAGTTNRR